MTLINPKALLMEQDAELARRSFPEFIRQAWHLVDPEPLRWGWHIDAIGEHLQAMTRRQLKKLAINFPPGLGKSLFSSVFWPAWEWAIDPTQQTIFASYAQDLVERDSVRCRDLLTQPWYQDRFVQRRYTVGEQEYVVRPNDVLPWVGEEAGRRAAAGWTPVEGEHVAAWSLNPAQNRVNSFKNTAGGVRQCLSVGSKATGFRAGKVVCDDPINMTDIHSEIIRAGVIFWWTKVMQTRVNNRARAAFLIVMQRGHEEDLTGHVLAGEGYEQLRLPSIYEIDRPCIVYIRRLSEDRTEFVKEKFFEDPRAHTPKKPDGEACELCLPKRVEESRHNETPLDLNCACDLLAPNLMSRTTLEEFKEPINGLGEDGFEAQHQQNPTNAEGGILKRRYWRFWRPDGTAPTGRAPRPKGCLTVEESPAKVLPRLHRIVCSLDAAFKDTKRSDFVVFTVWGVHFTEKYLLARVRDKMDFQKTCAVLAGCEKGWKKRCRGCSKCSAALRTRFPKCRTWLVEDKANGSAIINTLKTIVAGLIEVNPEGGKEARAAAMQPSAEAGNIYLPEGEAWLEEYVGECAAFPRGKHDDQVDSTSQAMIYLDANVDVTRALALCNSV